LRALAGAVLMAGAVGWWLTRPLPLQGPVLAEGQPDLANGRSLFYAGGCGSCHASPGEQPGSENPRLGGGLELHSPFGVFRAPNISPDPEAGIGSWSLSEFANAMLRGIGPDGRHLYPAFPYSSYSRMDLQDVADLKAWLDTLPAVANPSPGHTLRFPFAWRRALGLWKRLYLNPSWVRPIDERDAVLQRGRYLVEGPGHCGECHTPRGPLGGLRLGAWLTGAAALEGEGRVPDITAEGGLAGWSESDVAYYLESGIDPEFDVVGGSMVKVQENMAQLTAEDRAAIAAYLKADPR